MRAFRPAAPIRRFWVYALVQSKSGPPVCPSAWREGGCVFEVDRDRFQYIGAEIVPRLRLGEDGVPKRLRAKTAFLSVAKRAS